MNGPIGGGDPLHDKVLVCVVALNGGVDARLVEEWRASLPNDGADFILLSNEAVQAAGEIRTLRVPAGQGRGISRKVAGRLAVDEGYVFVIFVDAADESATEPLKAVIERYRTTRADVVLVTTSPSGNSRGWRGRLSRALQRKLVGRDLSRYADSCRGYATDLLRAVPFESNSNGDVFDTELLLQAFYVGARIEEVSRAGESGTGRVARTPARGALAAAAQFRLHQLGMLCTLKYRDLRPVRYADKTRALYTSHTMALRRLQMLRPRRVLDIGCGPGHVARALRESIGATVTGIDVHSPAAGSTDAFHPLDLERDPLPLDPCDFDAVLMLDVIEHLAEPERFLLNLRHSAGCGGNGANPSSPPRASVLLLTTPNVAFVMIRLNLLFGRFNYAERGILDITHKRLFTRSSLRKLLEGCGYTIQRIDPVPVPFDAVMPSSAGRLLARVAGALARIWPTMFAFQFLVEARPLPGLRQLLNSREPAPLADAKVVAR